MRELEPAEVERAVRAALAEDLAGAGDITTDAVVSPDDRAAAQLVARQGLVVAGLGVAREVFRQLDPSLGVQSHREDGQRAGAGEALLTVSGAARPILTGERAALNFLTRMCGIATAAARAVEEVRGTGARILDTRKTAPGLRHLDKYAVAAGGASNHRAGLHDAVMIKDTHLATGCSIGEAVARVIARGHPRAAITVEVQSVDELAEAIAAGAGRALLDNMDLDTLRRAVKASAGRIVLEASGGLLPGSLREVAQTGVDFLSLGWLTHSAPAADLAMELEALS